MVDLYHLYESENKIIECYIIFGRAEESLYDMSIADEIFEINVGRILIQDCLLFVTVEDDMYLQLTLLNMKRGMTMWP